MRRALFAALLAAAPVVAHAQAGDDFSRGVQLRVGGRPAEAIAPLQAAAAAHPNDPDIWLNLGLAYSALSRFDEADAALATAQRLAPDYADVEVARARLAYFRHDAAEAERRLAPVLKAHPDNGEAHALARDVAAARRTDGGGWRIDAAVSHANLSKRLPSADDEMLAVTRLFADGAAVTGSAERLHQFGATDTYLQGEVANRRGYVAVGGAPNADFKPEWQVRGGLNADPWRLPSGWSAQLSVDASWARYPVGDVRSVQPVLTVAHGDRIVLSGRWINTLDERDAYRAGYALRGVVAVASRLRLSAGWADAPESDQGATVTVRAVSMGAAFDLDDRTTLRLDGVHEMRRAYDRDELGVGLTRRF